MAQALRIVGWINIIAGVFLALVFQTLRHMLDSFAANLGSLSMLVGGVIGSLLFFAVARILDRVEEMHFAMGSPTEQLKRFK